MSKPLGMTADFRVKYPSVTEDAIWDAVESAIHFGWTVDRFMEEARNAWTQTHHNMATEAERAFTAKADGGKA